MVWTNTGTYLFIGQECFACNSTTGQGLLDRGYSLVARANSLLVRACILLNKASSGPDEAFTNLQDKY